MDKIPKAINSSDIYQLVKVNYLHCNLGRILITFHIILAAISIKSAVAAETTVPENQQYQSIEAQNLKDSSVSSGLTSQSAISLRRRLLAHKQSQDVAESQAVASHDFTTNVEPETFTNSFSENNITATSPDNYNTNYQTNEQINRSLATTKGSISDGEVHLQEQTNVFQNQQPQIIGQVDSSETVGDTFGDANKLRQELLIEPILTTGEPVSASPGSTAGTPSAYGVSFRQAYIAGGLFFPLGDDGDRVDGSLSFGFGLGDAVKSVGLEVNTNITSVGNTDNFDFGDSGSLGFKLHKYFPNGVAVAIGWSNAIKWGDVNKAKDTIYGVITKSFPLQPNSAKNKLPLTISVGIGSGSFRSLGAINAGDNSANLFASLGLRVLPQVSLVSSWTGNRLNMGASFAPFKKAPLVINAVFTDVTDNLNNGLGFSLSAGYSFRF